MAIWGYTATKSYFEQKRYVTSDIEESAQDKITKDFQDKKINENQYIKELAYSMWEPEKNSENYKSKETISFAPDIVQEVISHQNGLTQETKDYLYQKIFMTDFAFGKDDGESSFLFGRKAYASSIGNATARLEKAVVSPSKKFIVWYTETGSDKTTRKNAEKIAKNIDRVADEYEERYGIKYEYKPRFRNNQRDRAEKQLRRDISSIGLDPNLATSAMPIYLTNCSSVFGSDSIGFYVSSDVPLLIKILLPAIVALGEDDPYTGVASLPYIVIKPKAIKNDATKLEVVYSHELFHHFQSIYCGGLCPESKFPEVKFTKETAANWATSNVNPKNEILAQRHFGKYLDSYTATPIDEVRGYYTYPFLKMIEKSFGKNTVLKSMKEGDALNYFVKSAGGGFPKIFSDFAIKNVLNDYAEKSFDSKALPQPSGNIGTATNGSMNPATIVYYYVNTNKNVKNVLKISPETSNPQGSYVSILGRKGGLLDFISFSSGMGKYEVVTQTKLTSPMEFKISDYSKYTDVAIIISNGDVKNNFKYKIEMTSDTIYTMGEVAQEPTCKTVGTYDSIFEYFSRLPKIFSDFNRDVAKNTSGQDAALLSSANSLDVLSNSLSSTGNKQGSKGIIACSYPIKLNNDEVSVHNNIFLKYTGFKKSLFNFTKIDEKEPPIHYSLFSDYSFSNGLKFVNVITTLGGPEQAAKSADDEKYMGALVELKFEKLNR